MAINAISNLIVDNCPLLVANLAQNDKTPFLDGDISIYNSTEISNENCIGTVPVQVKGKSIDKIPRPPKYKIRVKDLRHYLLIGGAIYFVVYICNGKKEIYYIPLTVIKLQNFLSRLEPKQKYITVNLSKFSTDTNRIMEALRNFFEDKNKQHSFAKVESHTLEYWQKDPHFKSFSISAIGYGNTNPTQLELIESVNSHDNYAYVNLDNCPIPIPVSDENIQLALFNRSSEPVKVNEKTYYDNYIVIRNENVAQVQFGNAFTFTHYMNSDEQDTFRYTCPNNLYEIRKALALTKAICADKTLDIGGLHIPLIKLDRTIEDIESEEQYISHIIEVLEALHVDISEINYNVLSDVEKRSLILLYKGVVLKDVVPEFKVNEDFEHAIICTIKIGDKEIQVLISKTENGNIIEDYFNIVDKVLFLEKTDGSFTPATPYTLLTVDDFCDKLNLNHNRILTVHTDLYEKYPPIIYCAVDTLNTILRAYDKSKDKRLLQAAQQLSDWLQDKEINDITPYSKELCMLQIIKRQRELTFEEKGTLYKIAEEAEDMIDKFSSLVLLDEVKRASDVFRGQCEKCQEYLMVQPIYNLYDNLRKR